MGLEYDTKRSGLIIRKFLPQDAQALMAIAQESPEAASWSLESYLKLSAERGSVALIAENGAETSGFLIGRGVADQAEVLNLAVRRNVRRRGQGTALLAAALREFGLQDVRSVYLEVRESNTGAIAFYECHGFTKTDLRKAYYRNPDESAITMEKKLTV